MRKINGKNTQNKQNKALDSGKALDGRVSDNSVVLRLSPSQMIAMAFIRGVAATKQ